MANITRLVGKCDGNDIIFNYDGGQWLAVVPKDIKDGEYILELTAYDEAGNTAYTTAVLFTVDLAALKVEIKFLNYRFIVKEGYLVNAADAATRYKPAAPQFTYEQIRENFYYKAVNV